MTAKLHLVGEEDRPQRRFIGSRKILLIVNDEHVARALKARRHLCIGEGYEVTKPRKLRAVK